MRPPSRPLSTETLLVTQDVVKHYPVRGGVLARGGRSAPVVQAVDGVSLEVRAGETLGVVGESGCGKSTLGRCIARLTDLTAGTVQVAGRDISRLSRHDLRPVRRDVQMIFQDPYASLNPKRRVGDIVGDPLVVHGIAREGVRRRTAELLELVGLSAAHVDRYPHEFSGGQRQRIGIARALAVEPRLIVADEPVSALDVSIQAQVLNLFADLQDRLGLTYVFIAHDLGVVHHVSDRIAVMYLGEVVELAPADDLYEQPLHPYTEALLSVMPEVDDGTGSATPARERIVLRGDVPSPIDKPTGCPFHPRCRYAQDVCRVDRPPLVQVLPAHAVSCHFPLLPGTAAAP